MTAPTPRLEITGSRRFVPWLAEQTFSLAFSIYQAGKVFWIGLRPDDKLSIFERSIGLCSRGRSLYFSTLHQLWRFKNSLLPGQQYQG